MNKRAVINRAFTLTEVLLALGIFTVGFSMMALALPIAALMQKNTADGVFSNIIENNSKALVKVTELRLGNWQLTLPDGSSTLDFMGLDTTFALDSGGDAYSTYPPNYQLHEFPFDTPENDRTFKMLTQPELRSMPVNDPSPKLYWTPFIRRLVVADPNKPSAKWSEEEHVWFTKHNEWEIIICILRYRASAKYDRTLGDWAYQTNEIIQTESKIPGLVKVAATANGNEFRFTNDFHNRGKGQVDLQAGQKFLDEFGRIYTVLFADENSVTVLGDITAIHYELPAFIWYAPASKGGGDSPMLDIVTYRSSALSRLILDNKTLFRDK